MNSRTYYVYDDHLIAEADRLPAVRDRASMVHNLIAAYGLLEYMKIVQPTKATFSELKDFHSEMYLDHLKTFIEIDEDYMSTAQDEVNGIGYDCPPVSNMFDLVSTIAGGSITAAKCLILGIADVAINWCGGWHHAQRFGADGFCYVNDIVLAIKCLRKKFQKVLYIDLDVHHGNGVQDAFALSNSVFTLSVHKFEPGFYPGTGGIDDIGTLDGKGYTCNIPLKAAYSDKTLEFVFEKLFTQFDALFAPNAIVLQCGADALAYDPNGGASLTIKGYCKCLQRVLLTRKPTLLLGGGGYKHPNAARLWASITALVVGKELDYNIPEHDLWTSYGPDFMLPIELSLVRDNNTQSYLDRCLNIISENVKKYLSKKREEVEPEMDNRKLSCYDIKMKTNVQVPLRPITGLISMPGEKLVNVPDVYDFTDD